MKFRLLNADEIDVRVSQIDKGWCTLLLYKDARVDMNILDETVGTMNWQRTHEVVNGNLFCNVELWDDEKKQWIKKQDVGVESFSQEIKGEASDSFKRACFNIGIGRELYTAPSIFVTPIKGMTRVKEKDDEEPNEFFEKNGKYTTKTRFYVDYINYDEKNNISDLVIRDHKNNVRFIQLSQETEKERNKKILEFKKLIEKNEEKDDKFDRAKLYEYFKAETDAQIRWKDLDVAIAMLKKRLESE